MKKATLPSEAKTLQFESAHSCVLFTIAENKAGKNGTQLCPRLYVQSIDAYGFQRELVVQRMHEYTPSTGETRFYWQSHVYMHPGRREIGEVSESVASAFITRFLELSEKYPSLLFNAAFWRNDEAQTAQNVRPANMGFVTLCERLHRGQELKADML